MALSTLSNKEIKLLIFSLIVLFLLLACIAFEPLMDIMHALNKAVYSGYSTGKLLVSFAWFIVLPLLAFVSIRLRLHQHLERFEKLFLLLFIFSIASGFYLGASQFQSFASDYRPRWLFATIIYEKDYKNWEASKFYHNHFPKATLYFIEQTFGLDFSNKFDDGRPWFEFLPNARAYAFAYFLILVIALFSLLVYLFSIAKHLDLLNFFLLVSGSLGLLIYMLDGGIASAPISIVFFFFALFLVSRYAKFCKTPFSRASLALFASLAINMLSVGLFSYYLPTNNFQLSLVLFAFAAYVLFFEIKERRKRKELSLQHTAKVAFLLLLLAYSFNSIRPVIETYALGKPLVNYTELGYNNVQEGAGIFIYGLPAQISEAELKDFLQNYGTVLELNKTGWVAFARILPEGFVRDKEIESALKKKFKPSTYLYVEELAPRPSYESIYIYWQAPTNSRQYIRDEFSDIKVLRRIDKGSATILIVEARTSPTWQLLSVLTEIKENGYKGKLLVAK
ncbi:MAG: hypothetical protein J7J87_01195 [Candidatus Diapherotrites archaeon]|nr:hypothetical protein [Candidatus Diapherotrites archaeon]